VLRGERPARPVREAIVHHAASGRLAIRQGEWVLIESGTGDDNRGNAGEPAWLKRERGYKPDGAAGQLFNLRTDPAQKTNLHTAQPATVRALQALLDRYRREGRSTPGPAQTNDPPLANAIRPAGMRAESEAPVAEPPHKARQDDTAAQRALAIRFRGAKGVEKDPAEAVRYIAAHPAELFLLYRAHNAVHFPIYPGKPWAGKSTNGLYSDWVEEVDWSVGQVLDAVRDLQWKLVLPALLTNAPATKAGKAAAQARQAPQLFNLKTDLGETTDVAAQHPDIVARLERLVAQMKDGLGTAGPAPGSRPLGRVANPQPLIPYDVKPQSGVADPAPRTAATVTIEEPPARMKIMKVQRSVKL
jgi:hypothetical protein